MTRFKASGCHSGGKSRVQVAVGRNKVKNLSGDLTPYIKISDGVAYLDIRNFNRIG